MKIKLKSKRCSYEIDLHEKYTIITGDSGAGKTTFYKCVLDAQAKHSPIQIESDLPVLPIEKYTEVEALKKENVIYVVDEHCRVLQDLSKLNKINAYFVFIFRKQFDKKNEFKQLSISVTSVLKMLKDNKGFHYTEPLYKKFDIDFIGKVDAIITEDAKSSALFFEHYFPKIKVFTTNGKSAILPLLQTCMHVSTLVVYDSSAFGMYFADFQKYVCKTSDIKVLDWESFEEYILNLSFINYQLPEDTPCNFNSREIYAENQLNQFINYDKGKLLWCIDDTKSCSKCSYNNCTVSYADTDRERSLYIQGVLTSIKDNK